MAVLLHFGCANVFDLDSLYIHVFCREYIIHSAGKCFAAATGKGQAGCLRLPPL